MSSRRAWAVSLSIAVVASKRTVQDQGSQTLSVDEGGAHEVPIPVDSFGS